MSFAREYGNSLGSLRRGVRQVAIGIAIALVVVALLLTGYVASERKHAARWMFVGECGSGHFTPIVTTELRQTGRVATSTGTVLLSFRTGSRSSYSTKNIQCDDIDACRELVERHREWGGECVFRVEKKRPR